MFMECNVEMILQQKVWKVCTFMQQMLYKMNE